MTDARPLLAKPCYEVDWDSCVEAELGFSDDARAPQLKGAYRAKRRELRADCESGDAAACIGVAIMQSHGLGGTTDRSGAEYSLWRACELDLKACEPIAKALAVGDHVTMDRPLARDILVQGGHPPLLADDLPGADADKYVERIEVIDPTALLEQFAPTEQPTSSVGGTNRRKLRGYVLRCASHTSADACAKAAVMYDRGVGAARDEVAAYRFFQLACDRDPSLCVDIAHAYEEGDTVTRDRERAGRFREIALERKGDAGCRYGDSDQCVTYANAYLRGDHVAHDEQYAAVLFAEACDAGNARGCTGLAGLRWSGRGIEEDLSKAVELYATACDRSDGAACWKLGRLYLRGEQVGQDTARAEQLFARGCSLGDQASCDYLARKP